MKLVFLSNYLNHHQLPFCMEMQKHLGVDFSFIATEPMSQERIGLGYPDLDSAYPFVLKAYNSDKEKEQAKQIAFNADVVIIGSAPVDYVRQRLKARKLTFYYSERLYKKSTVWWRMWFRALIFYKNYGRYSNVYLLCASAYTAGDFAKTFMFKNKAYKWGYFPEVKRHEIDSLVEGKEPATILWAGRFIEWKHPEYVVDIAKRLKNDGCSFKIRMIGNGVLSDTIAQMIRDNNLEDCVEMLGALSPEEVRIYMEQSSIYLFTSDRQEGWGAVSNESMNSGCAVVASNAIGSVPFLLEDGQNGLIYESGDVEELYCKIKYLLDHPDICKNMGENAYKTMADMWNAENASQRLLALCQAFLEGDYRPRLYSNGPCSKADIIKNKHS